MSVHARDYAKKLAVDFPQKQLHELQIYSVMATASDLTHAADSSLLFELPEGCLVHSIGWEVLEAWDTPPTIQIGSSTDADSFCTLTIAELGLAGNAGAKMVGKRVTSTYTSTGRNITATCLQNSATTGEMNIWLYYRSNLGQEAALR